MRLAFLCDIRYKKARCKFGRHATRSRAYYNKEDPDIDSENRRYLNMRNKRIIQIAQLTGNADAMNKNFRMNN